MVVGMACRRFGLGLSLAVSCFLAFACPANAEAQVVAKVVVTGNGTELGETPVLAEVAAKVLPGSYRLRAASGGPAHFANVYQDGDKTYLAAVVDHVPAQGNVTYSLERALKVDRGTEGVSIVENPAGDVVVSIDGKPFTTYLAKEGARPYYFPVIGPTGAAVTRAYPMKTVEGEKRDHPHHQSLWFTHGNVNGVDFWSNTKGTRHDQGSHAEIPDSRARARSDSDHRRLGRAGWQGHLQGRANRRILRHSRNSSHRLLRRDPSPR